VVLTEDGHARLSDFGLSRELKDEHAATICYTDGYCAPEIIDLREKLRTESEGPAGYTSKIDLYSFGVVLFVLLTGGEAYDVGDHLQRIPPRQMTRSLIELCSLSIADTQGLLERLLDEEPSTRLSATQAKEHQWYEAQLGRTVDSLIAETS